MSTKYSFGIDLGTSNSAIAVKAVEKTETRIVGITQILGQNAIGERNTFPSALYLPRSGEFSTSTMRLPWETQENGEPSSIVGHFARDHGALIPDRLVTSAKSWLCNNQVDRQAPILPWKSDLANNKLSPVEASTAYLRHLRKAFTVAGSKEDESWTQENSQVVITVPASFDEVARSLTQQAADEAGFHDVTLIEEPIAAFYSWLERADTEWRNKIHTGDIVLVCDVGGGTADFSLIAVSEKEGNLQLDRISVGEHILLGGDNMDLALAYTVRSMTESSGKNIDDWQFLALIHACRMAKEKLFSDPTLSEVPISLPSRGSSLFSSTISTHLTREVLTAVTLEGFMPMTAVTDLPATRTSVGLQEFGLAYESDPVVSKHLARFLTRSLANVESNGNLKNLVEKSPEATDLGYLRPTAILFNGGVFRADPMRQRILELLNSWPGEEPVRELSGAELDLAVARGAARYGMGLITGSGVRVRAGTSRSYYLGLETSMPAIPGFKPPVKALCVVPQGMEEGTEAVLESREFGLVTGEPVTFRFFSSSIRAGDKVGTILPDAEKELEETSRLEITLPPIDSRKTGEVIPVELHTRVTELGALELWMQHSRSEQRWKLEFKVRTE